MSAETLRRASALMRERAEAATNYPWASTAPGEVWKHYDGQVNAVGFPDDFDPSICDVLDNADAQHIASWHPPVALAAADLLDLAATHEKREGDECGQGYTDKGYGYINPSCSACGTPDEYAEPWPCAYATRALSLARAYLGESS